LTTKAVVERAAERFLEFGVGPAGNGCVIIRCGGMGAYVVTRKKGGKWIDAFWNENNAHKIVDVTGRSIPCTPKG
jgi:hypothetical protein